METSITEQIFRTLVLLGILAIIIILGWNEPLKYRFMSRAEIYAMENPTQTTPGADKSWMWDQSRRTKLDRGAYNRNSSVTGYGAGAYWGR